MKLHCGKYLLLALLINSVLHEALRHDARGYLSMCVVVRNQHRDIREWILYHQRLGCSQFYVFDNASRPPMRAVLADFIKQGLVEYKHFERFRHRSGTPQMYAYDRCLRDHGARHTWMGFMDADEFIVLHNFTDTTSKAPLPQFLQAYEPYGALAVAWITVGSSGHVARPEGGVLANYFKCGQPGNPLLADHVKMIVNTRYTVQAGDNPHWFAYVDGKYAVDELFRKGPNEVVMLPQGVNGDLMPMRGIAEQPSTTKIAAYHYVLKSHREFKSKVRRGSGDGTRKTGMFFFVIDAMLARNDCVDAAHWAVRTGILCIDQVGGLPCDVSPDSKSAVIRRAEFCEQHSKVVCDALSAIASSSKCGQCLVRISDK